ncbi:MAG TPA: hypothetical protein VEX68_26910, partial [Bryobacteraceae bacterium]|nr:hypothetical protein [Bryobacteraceae bacterium]
LLRLRENLQPIPFLLAHLEPVLLHPDLSLSTGHSYFARLGHFYFAATLDRPFSGCGRSG